MSDENQSASDKSHEATPHKLQQAREKGEVAVSREISALGAYLGLGVAIIAFSGEAAETLARRMTPFLESGADIVVLTDGAGGMTLGLVQFLLSASAAALAIPAFFVIAGLAVQRAIVFAPSKIMPKFSRISPLSNFKQKYGPTGLMEFAKSGTKLGLVCGVLWFATVPRMDGFIGLVQADVSTLPHLLMREGLVALGAVIVISTAVAGMDFAWQTFDFQRRNRMTYKEVRDEIKQTDGDPEMKGRRRERAQSIAMNRMLLDVPNADVVITNPTHYAVALKWDHTPGSAPVCVAKGTDEIAARIREAAVSADVPLRPDPPLARSIHALVEIGRQVNPEHYRAVAAAILFAKRVREGRKGSTAS